VAAAARTGGLLDGLKKALSFEEGFVVRYDDESILALLRTLPPEKFRKIEPLLKENLSDTRRHYHIVEALIRKIEGGSHGL